VYRAANDKPLLFPDDAGIVGIASDVAVETALPTAHLDDIPAIAAMLLISAISLDDLLSMTTAEN
jgi:molybdopterin-guanine dinucleotide biosynthesis protein B